MKKIALTLIMLSASYLSYSQIYINNNNYGNEFNRVKVDSDFSISILDTSHSYTNLLIPRIRVGLDTQLYFWNTLSWNKINVGNNVPITRNLTINGITQNLSTDRTWNVGTVTDFSSGNCAPIFTTSVGNPTTTPSQTFTLSQAAAHTFLGNNTGVLANPSYVTLGTGDLPLIPLTTGITGTLPVSNGGTGNGTATTQGSVWFAGSGGILAQDNSNFFYNTTGHKLGLGTSSPRVPLDVTNSTSNDTIIMIKNGSSYAYFSLSSIGSYLMGVTGSNASWQVKANSNLIANLAFDLAQFCGGSYRLQDFGQQAIYYNTADSTANVGSSAKRFKDVYVAHNVTMANGLIWTTCTGSPEGVISAPVGSMCTRRDGGAGTTLYIKESGSGNTGWIAK